jgi:hypothetical protein
MKIEELNIIISDIEDMLLKSVYINVDIDNISPRNLVFNYMKHFQIRIDVPNPLHHLNDVKVNFFL